MTVLSNQRDVPVPKFTLAFLREYGQDWRDKDEHCSWNDLPQDASGAHEATFQTCQWQPTLKLHNKAYFLLLSFPSFCIFPFFLKKTQAKLDVIQAQLSVNRAKRFCIAPWGLSKSCIFLSTLVPLNELRFAGKLKTSDRSTVHNKIKQVRTRIILIHVIHLCLLLRQESFFETHRDVIPLQCPARAERC